MNAMFDFLNGFFYDGDEGGQGGGVAETPPEPEPDDPADLPADKTFDAQYVRKLRGEAADTRKKLRETEARLKTLEERDLSEAEKRDKRAAEAEKRAEAAEARARQAERVAACAAAGAINPERAARLLDDESDDPKAIKRAVTALKESDAYLFTRPGAGSADGGAGGNGQPARGVNDMIRRMAGRS